MLYKFNYFGFKIHQNLLQYFVTQKLPPQNGPIPVSAMSENTLECHRRKKHPSQQKSAAARSIKREQSINVALSLAPYNETVFSLVVETI